MYKFSSLMAALIIAGTLSSTAMAHDWKLGIGMQNNPGGGVRIVQVFPGSPAYDAKLQRGMILTAVNGIPMNNPWEVRDFIMNDNSDQLTLRVIINGWEFDYVADIITVAAVVTEGTYGGVAPAPKKTLRTIQIKRIGPARR